MDEEAFGGRFGKLVRGLNRTRALLQRTTEVAVACYQAHESGQEIRPILRRMMDEGLAQPLGIAVRAPIQIVRTEEDSNLASRHFPSRDYSARVGRKISFEGARDRTMREDPTLAFFSRYAAPGRSRHYGLPPTVVERFEPVDKEEEPKK